jgi:hypothetical protein
MPVEYKILHGKPVVKGHVPYINPEANPLRQEFRRHAGHPSRYSGGIVLAGTLLALVVTGIAAMTYAKRPVAAQTITLKQTP